MGSDRIGLCVHCPYMDADWDGKDQHQISATDACGPVLSPEALTNWAVDEIHDANRRISDALLSLSRADEWTRPDPGVSPWLILPK